MDKAFKFTVIQSNMGRGHEAGELVTKKIKEEKIDIALIQEPSTKLEAPEGYKILKHDIEAKTAIIIRNDIQDILIRNDITDKNTQTITITTLRNKITIMNIYDEPGGKKNQRFDKHKNALTKLPGQILIAGDFNAKNMAWGGNTTDDRGENLYEWVELNNFKIENIRHDPPTYDCPRGKSWVDLQLTKHMKITDRWISDEETLSDHRYILYKISTTTMKTGKKRFNIHKANWDRFEDELKNWEDKEYITTTEEIEEEANRFDKFCKICCEKAIPTYNSRKPKTSNIWWNDELERKRKQINKKRTEMQSATIGERPEKERAYKAERNEYKKLIKKLDSLKKYIEECSQEDPWGKAYNLLKKDKQKTVLGNVKKPDGTWTNTEEETEIELINKYFPKDDEGEETSEQKEIRRKNSLPYNEELDRVFRI